MLRLLNSISGAEFSKMNNFSCGLLAVISIILYSLINVANCDNVFLRSRRQTYKGCKLPPHPEHGNWTVYKTSTNFTPGMIISSQKILDIQCNDKYKLIGNKHITCIEDGWSEAIGHCLKTCTPRYNTTTRYVTCTRKNVPLKNCENPVEGTRSRFECVNYYEFTSLNLPRTHICKNGKWNYHLPDCVPICGQKIVNKPTLIVNGQNTNSSEYPWQVAIYNIESKLLICGGVLINQRMVLTAAHCITDDKGNRKPKEMYNVAVGKTYSPIDDARDANEAQFSDIEHIFVPSSYKGNIQNYIADIGIMIANKSFTITENVHPICVDWDLNHILETSAAVYGYVSGWGYTTESGTISDELKYLKLPLVSHDECKKHLPQDYERFLTYDKICAGFLNASASVCKGDSGGGLVFRYGSRYYIMGIVSSAPQATTAEGGCDSQKYSIYTRVSDYIWNFIFEKDAEFKPVPSDEIDLEDDLGSNITVPTETTRKAITVAGDLCTIETTNAQGVCKYISSCNKAQEDLKKNITSQECGYEAGELIVCCEEPVDESKKTKNICFTSSCIETATSVLARVDLNVNPCEDFYNFACGNFLKNAIPDKNRGITLFTIVNDLVSKKMQHLLTKPIDSQDIKAFVLAKSLYQSCMNTTDIESNSLNEMKRTIKEAGGWPVIENDKWNDIEFDWISISYKFMHNGFNDFTFFYFEILTDPNNSSKSALVLNKAGVSSILRSIEEYYKYMVKVAEVFGADKNTVAEEMEDLANFMVQIATIAVSEEGYDRFENNPMSIRSLEIEFPYVPWLTYINIKLNPYKKMTYDDIIIVRDPLYFKKLGVLLENTLKRTLANYMFWYAVEVFISSLNDELRDIKLEYSSAVFGESEQPLRSKECTEIVSTKLFIATGSLYVRNYVLKESKKILMMMKLIQGQFVLNLDKVDWMDPITKKHAIEKAEAIHFFASYPNELLDDEKLNDYYQKLTLSSTNFLGNILNISLFNNAIEYSRLNEVVDKKDWRRHSSVTTVNSFYDVTENSIDIRAAILQDAYYEVSRPQYMNYGAIGSFVGYEITQGFYHLGSQYDKDGRLMEWWQLKTKEDFDQKTQCLVDQFGNITVPEISLNINGIATLHENIADNGGIKMAYLAYKEWSREHDLEPELPGLSYSPEQMFWISMGNIWCDVHSNEILESEVKFDSNPPARYRVNVPLMNSEYFAKDFGCEEGTTMNPKNKCQVW